MFLNRPYRRLTCLSANLLLINTVLINTGLASPKKDLKNESDPQNLVTQALDPDLLSDSDGEESFDAHPLGPDFLAPTTPVLNSDGDPDLQENIEHQMADPEEKATPTIAASGLSVGEVDYVSDVDDSEAKKNGATIRVNQNHLAMEKALSTAADRTTNPKISDGLRMAARSLRPDEPESESGVELEEALDIYGVEDKSTGIVYGKERKFSQSCSSQTAVPGVESHENVMNVAAVSGNTRRSLSPKDSMDELRIKKAITKRLDVDNNITDDDEVGKDALFKVEKLLENTLEEEELSDVPRRGNDLFDALAGSINKRDNVRQFVNRRMYEVKSPLAPPLRAEVTGSILRQFVFFVLTSFDIIDNNALLNCFREEDQDAMIDILRHGDQEAVSSVAGDDIFKDLPEDLPQPPPGSSDKQIEQHFQQLFEESRRHYAGWIEKSGRPGSILELQLLSSILSLRIKVYEGREFDTSFPCPASNFGCHVNADPKFDFEPVSEKHDITEDQDESSGGGKEGRTTTPGANTTVARLKETEKGEGGRKSYFATIGVYYVTPLAMRTVPTLGLKVKPYYLSDLKELLSIDTGGGGADPTGIGRSTSGSAFVNKGFSSPFPSGPPPPVDKNQYVNQIIQPYSPVVNDPEIESRHLKVINVAAVPGNTQWSQDEIRWMDYKYNSEREVNVLFVGIVSGEEMHRTSITVGKRQTQRAITIPKGTLSVTDGWDFVFRFEAEEIGMGDPSKNISVLLPVNDLPDADSNGITTILVTVEVYFRQLWENIRFVESAIRRRTDHNELEETITSLAADIDSFGDDLARERVIAALLELIRSSKNLGLSDYKHNPVVRKANEVMARLLVGSENMGLRSRATDVLIEILSKEIYSQGIRGETFCSVIDTLAHVAEKGNSHAVNILVRTLHEDLSSRDDAKRIKFAALRAAAEIAQEGDERIVGHVNVILDFIKVKSSSENPRDLVHLQPGYPENTDRTSTVLTDTILQIAKITAKVLPLNGDERMYDQRMDILGIAQRFYYAGGNTDRDFQQLREAFSILFPNEDDGPLLIAALKLGTGDKMTYLLPSGRSNVIKASELTRDNGPPSAVEFVETTLSEIVVEWKNFLRDRDGK